MKRYNFVLAQNIRGLCNCQMEECDGGYFVLYSEAQARIEALEWLVEVIECFDYLPDPTPARPFLELISIRDAARAAAALQVLEGSDA